MNPLISRHFLQTNLLPSSFLCSQDRLPDEFGFTGMHVVARRKRAEHNCQEELIRAKDALWAMKMVTNNSYSRLLPEIIVILLEKHGKQWFSGHVEANLYPKLLNLGISKRMHPENHLL
ncbi:hypothetical protein Tco_1045798 [Tanacetum coccineum]|uniref:Uncharacterized protein n=1 Tax=Tanacetum coccineum TaxID=301880 RepID=A0ABQ5GW99_9ASTR